MKKYEDIKFSWGEARYLDLWAIPHLLSGAALAFLLLSLGGLRAFSYGITFLVLAGWELGESLFGITEARENSILDVVIGVFGFVLAYEIGRLFLGPEAVTALFVFDVIVLLLLTFFGWLDYKKRSKSE